MPAILHLTLGGTPCAVYPKRLHGAACVVFEGGGADHHAQSKPFCVGPLRPGADGTDWRLGWLGADIVRLRVPEAVRLGDETLPVIGHRIEPASYAELSTAQPAWSAKLNVVSPLYFSRKGRDYPSPDPELIVSSLARRWNDFAPPALAVDIDLRDELLSSVLLDEFSGRTVRTRVTYTQEQIGFLGTVRIALPRWVKKPVAVLFAALMRFSLVSGIGAQTTHGYGQVDLLELGGRSG